MGEIDIGLRTISQLLPEDLAAPFMPPGSLVERDEPSPVLAGETQLSRRELRLDKVLAVRVDGSPRLLHVEFQTERDTQMGPRILEYGAALLMTSVLAKSAVLPIKHVVVLLSGAKDLEPSIVSEQYGWPGQGEPGMSVSYQLEPVYRYNLETLRARPVLWWVFAPLARDVDADRFDELLRELRERVENEQMQAELGAVMRVLAERNERVPGLAARVGAILGEELLMQSEFLKSIREDARREELLRIASWVTDDAELERLRHITEFAELEREIRQLLDRRLRGAAG